MIITTVMSMVVPMMSMMTVITVMSRIIKVFLLVGIFLASSKAWLGPLLLDLIISKWLLLIFLGILLVIYLVLVRTVLMITPKV